jgi:RNA polymerase sigma-70 factor (ECF subfamily)
VKYLARAGHSMLKEPTRDLVGQDDRSRFEDLYRETVRRLLAYVLTRTNPDNASDVVSSTYLVAWRRFDEVPADALPWLIGVARRVLADQRRSGARQHAVGQRLGTEPSAIWDLGSSVTESMVLRSSIRGALVQMRPEDRDIVILVAWHGFGTEQLAVTLGCSKSVASVRLHRARRRFARHLKTQDHPIHMGQQMIQPAKEVP